VNEKITLVSKGYSTGRAAKAQNAQKLTADSRRFSQIRIRTFHRRDAEYAEEIPFAQSGNDDWAKSYSSNPGKYDYKDDGSPDFLRHKGSAEAPCSWSSKTEIEDE